MRKSNGWIVWIVLGAFALISMTSYRAVWADDYSTLYGKVRVVPPNVVALSEPRGMESLTASLYDNVDLDPASFLVSLPYTGTIDFYLSCYGEGSACPSCRLFSALSAGDYYSVRWQGYLWVPANGVYTFSLSNVDDGVRVFIDDAEVVDNGWYYPNPDHYPSPQARTLSKGKHSITIDYEQRPPFIASAQLRWSGPGFTDEIIPNLAFKVNQIRIIPDDGAGDLSWSDGGDRISFDTFDIEIIGAGALPPDRVDVSILSMTTNKRTALSVPLVNSQGTTHKYRTSVAVSSVTNSPTGLTASVLINDSSEKDYEVARKTLDYFALSEKRQLGIAWYNGLYTGAERIPQANRRFMQAAGFEAIKVTINPGVPTDVVSEYGFVKNQGDVFFYFGHGRHDDNYVFVHRVKRIPFLLQRLVVIGQV